MPVPKDLAQVIDDQRVVWNLAAWGHMEVRRNKCNLYTQELLELDSYLPVAGQGMLAKVNMPLQLMEWERAMAGHPDWEFVEYLLRGIKEGFRIGYNHRGHTCSPASKNMHSADRTPRWWKSTWQKR